jgi:hypothetical protein
VRRMNTMNAARKEDIAIRTRPFTRAFRLAQIAITNKSSVTGQVRL